RYLTPGYWNRPDLNQSVFAPAGTDTDERLFFTGDMGLLRSDGSLVHLGRKDLQLKVRGYRIEPGDIEAAIMDSGVVKEVVVVARPDGEGDQRLIAYVVPVPGASG